MAAKEGGGAETSRWQQKNIFRKTLNPSGKKMEKKRASSEELQEIQFDLTDHEIHPHIHQYTLNTYRRQFFTMADRL